jgi:hypothetical protein
MTIETQIDRGIVINIKVMILNIIIQIEIFIEMIIDREMFPINLEKGEKTIQTGIINMVKAEGSVIDRELMKEEEMIVEKASADIQEIVEKASVDIQEIVEKVIDIKILRVAEVDIVAEVIETAEATETEVMKGNTKAEIEEMNLRMIGEVVISALNTQIL